MVISADLVDKVTSIFGTPNEVFYEYLWIARVIGLFNYVIIVAVVKVRRGGFRGLLLGALPSPPWYSEYGGANPISYLEFTNRNDPVHDLFRSGIVLSESEGTFLDGDPYVLDCYVASENMISQFSYNSDSDHDKRRVSEKYKLKEALFDTILFLGKTYNNPEINEYLKPPDYREPEG